MPSSQGVEKEGWPIVRLVKELWKGVLTSVLYNTISSSVLVPTAVLFTIGTRGAYACSFFISAALFIPAPINYRLLAPGTTAFAIYILHYYRLLFKHRTGGPSSFPWTRCTFDGVIACFCSCYFPLYAKHPEEDGKRRSPKVVDFLRRHVYDHVTAYLRVKVLCEAEMRGALCDPRNKFIFGSHPHGVFAGTPLYLYNTSAWMESLGSNDETHTTCHVASVSLNVPFLRDFLMAGGCRAVSRSAIERNLEEGNSSLIVVGGQAEQILNRFSETEQHYVINHIGFIRIALRKRVPPCPVINFAEHNILDMWHWYGLHRRALRTFGFNTLTSPKGWLWTWIPNRVPVTVAVGRPIHVPDDVPTDPAEFEELACEIAEKYYQEVIRVFYTYRAQSAYPNIELFLHYGLPDRDPTVKGKPEYENARTHPDRPFRFPRQQRAMKSPLA